MIPKYFKFTHFNCNHMIIDNILSPLLNVYIKSIIIFIRSICYLKKITYVYISIYFIQHKLYNYNLQLHT